MNNNFNHFLVQRSIVKEWWRKGFNFSDYLHIYLFLTNKLAILIAVAKTSRTMLNSSGENGHPCLVPDFRGNAFNFSPLRITFAVGLSYSFYYVEVCSFYSCFLESFYHKWMLNFVKGFLCIYWDNISLLFFNLLMWCITLIDLWILKNPCTPGIKPTWSWAF